MWPAREHYFSRLLGANIGLFIPLGVLGPSGRLPVAVAVAGYEAGTGSRGWGWGCLGLRLGLGLGDVDGCGARALSLWFLAWWFKQLNSGGLWQDVVFVKAHSPIFEFVCEIVVCLAGCLAICGSSWSQ